MREWGPTYNVTLTVDIDNADDTNYSQILIELYSGRVLSETLNSASVFFLFDMATYTSKPGMTTLDWS